MIEASLPELEKSLPALRADYQNATSAFVDLAEKKTKAAEKGRLQALRAWHAAGSAFFNAHERLITLGALAKADKIPAWFTNRAETSVNLLHTICKHYRTLQGWVVALSLNKDEFTASPTAFANMQRLVQSTHSGIARAIRCECIGLGLPTHGFDTVESVQPGTDLSHALWERICGTIASGVALLVLAYLIVRNEPFADPNYVVFVRTLLSFCMAVFGGCIPGFLHLRFNQGKTFAVRASGASALFLITFFFTPEVLPHHASPNVPPSARPLDDIDIVDVGFMDYPGDARAPRLDIKLANRGTAPAFIKNVRLKVKQVWRLPAYSTVGAVVPPSHEYVARLKPAANYEVNLSVSHGLRPDEMDRFTVQLEETDWAASNTIYLADVDIIANGNALSYRKENLLFLVTQEGDSFPKRADIDEMVRAQKSLGRKVEKAEIERAYTTAKAMILEASLVKGLSSHSMLRLIETTKSSDLR